MSRIEYVRIDGQLYEKEGALYRRVSEREVPDYVQVRETNAPYVPIDRSGYPDNLKPRSGRDGGARPDKKTEYGE